MLTARVIVNRVWQHHFGRGLVRSANNFGELGTPPTHPELLDYLALWLVDHNWQLKPLHRLIMTSNAYRMSSAGNAKALAVDPDERSVLAVRHAPARVPRKFATPRSSTSGQFNPDMFGPASIRNSSQEVLATQSRPGDGWGQSTPEEQARRSIYIHVKRSLLPPLLTAFDFPDVDSSCEGRFVTTQPGQALAMLHGEFLNEQAAKLAAARNDRSRPDPRAQVAQAIRLALERPATDEEIADGLDLIEPPDQRARPKTGRCPKILVPHGAQFERIRVLGLDTN